MIQVTNLSFSHLRPIFKNISFNVGNNQIVGLTGPNGAGKSTLFKLLTGDEKPKEGSIFIDGTIMLVPQEIKYDPALEESNTVREYLDKDFVEEDQKILSMLQGLELRNVDLYSSAKNLSGGQKTKLAIIRALLKEPDILLLDEPTNFLDTKGKFWVASFLSKYPKTLILVSHDLALLDKSINKVIAINPETASIEEYKGNYSQYIKVKSQKDAHLVRQVTNTQKHIKRMEKSLVGLMGRKSEKGVRQRVQLQKRIQRIKESLPPLPATARGFRMEIPQPKKVSQIPIKLNNISKRFGELTIFENFSVTIEKGDRIAVIGHNGAGKSTLLKMLVEKLSPDQGEIVRAENLKIGYYTQELEALDFQKDLFEMVESIKMLPHERIRSHLASFLFTGNKVFQKVGSLSGGEKTRLSIALLLLEDYNMLVLDEPTTYLDVLSQRIILEAIKKYKGTLVIVSHTEDFVEELRPTKAIIMPDQKVKFWENELLEIVSYI